MPTPTTTPLRTPLSSQTNSPPTAPTPSPTAKPLPAHPLRRPVSFRTLHPHLDSSESDPSAHSSIFEAFYLHHGALEKLDADPPPALKRVSAGRPSGGGGSSEADGGNASSSLPVVAVATAAAAARDAWLGTGTPLATIAEQKSVATLRAVASLPQLRSSRDRGITPRRAKPSPLLLAQHKHSFSADDLPLRLRRRRSPLSGSGSGSGSTSTSTTTTSHPHTHNPPANAHAPANPNEPTAPPPHRMPTPPGLPTFGSRAAHNYRIETPFRFRDFFSRHNHSHYPANGTQTVGLPRGVVARSPTAVVRARWVPTQSGHTGRFAAPGIAAHPFHNASLANANAKSATVVGGGQGLGREGEESRDRRAVESRSVPVRRREPRSARARRPRRFVPSSALSYPHPDPDLSATDLYHRALSAEPAFRGGVGPVGVGGVGGGGGGGSGSTPRVFGPATGTPQQAGGWHEVADRRSRWEGFCEMVCVGCCGVERPGSGEEMARPVRVVEVGSVLGSGGRAAGRRGAGVGEGLGGYVP